jgi:acyl-coenzyme A thioesterase PaaI-like protein
VDRNEEWRARDHVLRELGFTLRRAGDEFDGSAAVVPEMWVPGTRSLRTSILATWTDTAAGYVAVERFAPRVPVTLELDVHVYPSRGECAHVRAVSRTVKAGRSVVVAGAEFVDEHDEPLAVGTASFMAARDASLTMQRGALDAEAPDAPRARLQMPFAQRARCERLEPGVATVGRADDTSNASNTLNGGLIALVVEEAALSCTPGATLCSMAMRFLRPVRVGPAIATADVHGGLGRVEVHDHGDDERHAVVATTRTFAARDDRAA